MSHILTPYMTQMFVGKLRTHGYIEPEENFPAVAEFPLGFIAVVRDDNEGRWMVTAYYTEQKSWQACPTHETDSLTSALALFGYEVSIELSRQCDH